MYRRIITSILILATLASQAVEITPAHRQRARSLVSQMTFDEKVKCLAGKTSFSLWENPRLGIPEIRLADGPQGIRNHAPYSTLYPCGILAAATFNRPLIYRYGESLGDDARARGVGILLGPGVNMYRSPLCGRNYEYMGEDPYLTSEISTNYIKGVQSKGVIATIKHFAGNNQEWSRHHVSSDIDERTLHEIYFPAFRSAVEKAGVGAVMNSYNLLNGVHATENRWLDTDILRNLWGFQGLLMSDWTSVYSTVNATAAGLDLEMPKPVWFTAERLREALDAGLITQAMIDQKVEHILSTLIAFGLLDRTQRIDSIPLDYAPSRQTALEVARQGVVMLKNEGNLLPLKGVTLVLGPAADTIVSGGGSGSVQPLSVQPVGRALKALRKKTRVLTDDMLYRSIAGEVFTDSTLSQKGFAASFYANPRLEGTPEVTRIDPEINFNWRQESPAEGIPTDKFSASWQGFHVAQSDGILRISVSGDDGYRVIVNGKTMAADWGNHSVTSRQVQMPVQTGKIYNIRVDYFDNISDALMKCSLAMLDDNLLSRELRRADNVVLCTGFDGDIEGEGFDRPFSMGSYKEEFISKVAALNPNLTVVVNAGGGLDFAPWINDARAILMAWYPGQEGGQAIAEILTGKISPSGKLPISIEKNLADNPCATSYYTNSLYRKGSECDHVVYKEGIFTGYRGYDRTGVEPLFPFGFGLSYSEFEFSDLALTPSADGSVTVTFTLANTGKKEASEVAQVYVGDPVCSLPRPKKELKGFEKVTLKPGQRQTLSITLPREAFQFYNPDCHAFVVEPGVFEISVGNSSASLPLKGEIELN